MVSTDLMKQIEQSLALPWVRVKGSDTSSTSTVHVLDSEGDRIPLVDLLESPQEPDDPNDVDENGGSDSLGSGAIAGIVLGVLAAFGVVIVATYKFAYSKGVENGKSPGESTPETHLT